MDQRRAEAGGMLHGSDGGRAEYVARAGDVSANPQRVAADCCDRCGSLRLIRVKACWRCEACGYKSDCNGW
jgi:hypothetical protein